MIALALLACIPIAGWGYIGLDTAAASAGPTVAVPTTAAPPERPPDDGRVVFTDDPSIVDARPLPIDSWSRLGNGEALAVHFTVGSPECFGVHASVCETTETVTVELRAGSPPEAVGRMCIMIAVFGTLDVPLQSPLGDREVLSVH